MTGAVADGKRAADAVVPRGAPWRETDDLSFAAFAHMRGLRLLKASEQRRGRVEYAFTFEDPSGRWEGLQIEFANSECAQFDASVRTLKQCSRRNGSGG